jgi:hypothetical protein
MGRLLALPRNSDLNRLDAPQVFIKALCMNEMWTVLSSMLSEDQLFTKTKLLSTNQAPKVNYEQRH